MTTVLIVDDEIDMRVLIRVAIQIVDDGLEVVGEASDGLEALDAWRDLDGPPEPDVVILDNRMPGLTGLEVAKRILEQRPDQRIILYSAWLDDDLVREASRLGVSRCVVKDDADKLASIVQEVARS